MQEISPEGVIKIKSEARNSKSETKELMEYAVPAKRAIWVKQGDQVAKGQQLCEGHVDLAELFGSAGRESTEKYIVQEVQRIYSSQGASIHDKHIEVICRQMFSRVRVKEAGDSRFIEGEVVERPTFVEENRKLKKQEKKPASAVQLLLGVSKVALTTESFLSAASFQETSRVLIRASLEAKEDRLRGLKENVIIGKLIPAGRGFKP